MQQAVLSTPNVRNEVLNSCRNLVVDFDLNGGKLAIERMKYDLTEKYLKIKIDNETVPDADLRKYKEHLAASLPSVESVSSSDLDDLEIAENYCILGDIYLLQGMRQEASQVFEKALDIRKRKLPFLHLSIIQLLVKLASIHKAAEETKKIQSALVLAGNALDRSKDNLQVHANACVLFFRLQLRFIKSLRQQASLDSIEAESAERFETIKTNEKQLPESTRLALYALRALILDHSNNNKLANVSRSLLTRVLEIAGKINDVDVGPIVLNEEAEENLDNIGYAFFHAGKLFVKKHSEKPYTDSDIEKIILLFGRTLDIFYV